MPYGERESENVHIYAYIFALQAIHTKCKWMLCAITKMCTKIIIVRKGGILNSNANQLHKIVLRWAQEIWVFFEPKNYTNKYRSIRRERNSADSDRFNLFLFIVKNVLLLFSHHLFFSYYYSSSFVVSAREIFYVLIFSIRIMCFFCCSFVFSQESAMNPNYNYTNTSTSQKYNWLQRAKSRAMQPLSSNIRTIQSERWYSQTDVVFTKEICNTITCISLWIRSSTIYYVHLVVQCALVCSEPIKSNVSFAQD